MSRLSNTRPNILFVLAERFPAHAAVSEPPEYGSRGVHARGGGVPTLMISDPAAPR